MAGALDCSFFVTVMIGIGCFRACKENSYNGWRRHSSESDSGGQLYETLTA
jgi:hypothetical protein